MSRKRNKSKPPNKQKDSKSSRSKESILGLTSSLVHSNIRFGTDFGAIHYAIQPSVTFGYEDVNDLVDVFQNRKKGYAYSRNSSPTTTALEQKITMMEDGKSSIVFATGLAAISSALLSLLKEGDHLVVSQFLFGNTHSFFNTLIRLGYAVDFVDVTDAQNVKNVLKPNTKFFFTETIANPGTQISDLVGIAKVLNHHRGRKIISIIDNTMTTPYLFKPKTMHFTFSINALTKYIAGQGSCLAGSLTDLGEYCGIDDENIMKSYKNANPEDCLMLQIRKKGMRDMGATLSPFSAYLVSLGAETLELRMQAQMNNALAIAKMLNRHPKIAKVYYPGLPQHPQNRFAKKYFNGFGALMSFVLKEKNTAQKPPGSRSRRNDIVTRFMNSLSLIIKSSHLGDTRTLSIPVARTIFYEMGIEERKSMGIHENQIRLSVGIENQKDLLNDLQQALSQI